MIGLVMAAYIEWDPPALTHGFWLPLRCEAYEKIANTSLCERVGCSESLRGIAIMKNWGRMGNALLELAHTIQVAMTADPPLTVLFDRNITAPITRAVHEDDFNLTSLRSFACIEFRRQDFRHGLIRVAAKNVFEMTIGRMAFSERMVTTHIISQIVLRPYDHVRRAVVGFERDVLNGAPYVAIHLRSLENGCTWRAGKAEASFFSRVTPEHLKVNETVFNDHVCHMSDAYLEWAFFLLQVPAGTRVVLAHDREDVARAEDILARWQGVAYDGVYGPVVDLQLLMRADFLIGNPASTYSRVASDVRCLLHPRHDPNSNLYCSPDYPNAN